MKKKFTLLCLILLIFYFYKPTILDTRDAVLQAEMYLNKPPDHTYMAPIKVNVRELAAEQIQTQLFNQNGILDRMFNRMQWEITFHLDNSSTTVVIDAYNGKLIQIIGALN
ncbi:hypothetical protein ACIQXI_10715 [Lysinibacillus sp. NPDC097195]|uniref:hypothetical protein n=1 Tax=Lysinibacillus sp. NPDC097195 TaxID=3364141 RepID=UPI00381927B4